MLWERALMRALAAEEYTGDLGLRLGLRVLYLSGLTIVAVPGACMSDDVSMAVCMS
jgi:hypothetical protein